MTEFAAISVLIVTGHYGVGKTNLALNIVLDARAHGAEVTLIDLDVVNPYFRSGDYQTLLKKHDVRLIAPVFSGTNLDSPGLSGAISAVFEWAQTVGQNKRLIVIDAGGDDVGVKALGRFAPIIAQVSYKMFYVVNRNRHLTYDVRESAELLYEIETTSHLKACAVVNNTHLQNETDEGVIRRGIAFAKEVADLLNLPLAATTIPEYLLGDVFNRKSLCAYQNGRIQTLYPVQIYVHTPWDIQNQQDRKRICHGKNERG